MGIELEITDAELAMLADIARRAGAGQSIKGSFSHNDDAKPWRSRSAALAGLAKRIVAGSAPLSDQNSVCPSTIPLPF